MFPRLVALPAHVTKPSRLVIANIAAHLAAEYPVRPGSIRCKLVSGGNALETLVSPVGAVVFLSGENSDDLRCRMHALIKFVNYPIGTGEGKGALSPMKATLLAYFVLSLGGSSVAALVQTDSLDKRLQTLENRVHVLEMSQSAARPSAPIPEETPAPGKVPRRTC
jgi:hypothetical protein